MIITNKKMFWFLVAYVTVALSGCAFNVWIGFTSTPLSFIAAAICVFFAAWIGSDVTDYVKFPPKEKHPLL